MRRALVTMLTLAAAYAPCVARANGRFPRAQQVVVDPTDPKRLAVRTTFGVLTSNDGGAHLRWLCEEALGFQGAWDPPLAFTSSGALLAGLTDGLATARDACGIHHSLAGELVSDLSRVGDGALLATSTAGSAAALWRVSADGRATRLGKGLDGVYLDTLDAAPSRPSRVYATGVMIGAAPAPHLFVSDDGGATLKEVVPALPTQGRLYLAAVDPHDPLRLFVRQLGERGSELLVSGDGGHSFAVALHMDGAMLGFALDATGEKVWVGSAEESQGIFYSDNGGVTFRQAARAIVYGLARAGDALYVCSEAVRPGGYALGVSRDDGATITPLATFADVQGPSECDAGEATRCLGEPWSKVRATLATASSAAMSEPDTDASIVDAASAAPAPPRPSRCACETAPATPTSPAPWLALLALGLLASRRARWIAG